MATATITAHGSSAPVLAYTGDHDLSEDNDRIARIEVRPGMSEGEHLAIMLRCWGSGHWCRSDGQPNYFTLRADAEAAAARWIETGRG